MITGLDQFVRDFALNVLQSAAVGMLDDVRDAAPIDSGELIGTRYGPTLDPGNMTATIGFSAPQADYTDKGTVPHGISPRFASALRFFWPNGPAGPGTYVFDHVSHPGQSGTGWFTDTIEDGWESHVQDAAGAPS
jgi:hypothetical protein